MRQPIQISVIRAQIVVIQYFVCARYLHTIRKDERMLLIDSIIGFVDVLLWRAHPIESTYVNMKWCRFKELKGLTLKYSRDGLDARPCMRRCTMILWRTKSDVQ